MSDREKPRKNGGAKRAPEPERQKTIAKLVTLSDDNGVVMLEPKRTFYLSKSIYLREAVSWSGKGAGEDPT